MRPINRYYYKKSKAVNHEAPKHWFKDFALLSLGALITLITSYLTESRRIATESRKEYSERKMQLCTDLSCDLGERQFLMFEYYKRKRDNDTAISSIKEKFFDSKHKWNIKGIMYRAMLRHYYTPETQYYFEDSIYVPMIELSKRIEKFSKPDPEISARITTISYRTEDFVNELFKKNLPE